MNHHMVGICAQCGGPCDNRATRCQRCYDARGKDPEKRVTGWAEARDLYPLVGVLCENGCGKPAVEHHHLDGDPLNNERSNVMCVCRRCHMHLDGRLYSDHERPRGAENGNAKLTEDIVREIRRRRPAELLSTLAAEYGVTETTVSEIANRRTWRHV